MSARVIDESHFNFHVVCKSKIINAVNKLGKGVDFLSQLSKLKFSTDKRWTQNTCKDPNVTALLGILDDYKKLELRQSRANLIVPIIEYAIGLYASDIFYKERMEWFLVQLMERSGQFRFHECFANPENWYPNTRNEGYGLNTDINEDYVKWYGVDPRKDECVISYDMINIKELIRQQKEIFDKEEMQCM